jgi:hypothetical protein
MPRPAPTAPWRATPSAEAKRPARIVFYVLAAEQSEVRVSLPAKRATPRGWLPVMRGELSLDTANLAGSSAAIDVDLGALRLEDTGADDAGVIDRSRTARALAWANLGSNLPDADRERRRWVRFTLRRSVGLGAEHPLEGKPVALDAAAPEEVRKLRFDAAGELLLNDHRVEHTVPTEARFHYTRPAARTADPTMIVLETASPIKIGLAEHDLKPRDDSGRFLAREAKLLGEWVGQTAVITARFTFVPKKR